MKTVLIMGFRKQIAQALSQRSIPFHIWNDKPLKSKTGALSVLVKPFPQKKEELLSEIRQGDPITHIIAGTEGAVLPASLSRAWMDIERNSKSVLERCSDKLKMKSYLSNFNVPMTPFLSAQTSLSPEEIFNFLGNPFLAKERRNSGGKGINLVNKTEDLANFKNSDHLYEKLVKGTEGSVESFIFNREIVFSNITRYEKIKECNLIPANYDEETCRSVSILNQKVIKSMNIKWGMSHLEFYITTEGILFGEIALRPPGGYIMNGIKEAYGFDPWEAFVDTETGVKPEINREPERFAATYVLHPGAGKVTAIEGAEECKDLGSLKKLKLKVEPGEDLQRRAGAGDDKGYAIFSNPNQDKLLKDLQKFRQTLVFRLE